MKPVIEARSLVIGYNGYELSGVLDFRLEGPMLVQILGPNGAGKTTLLRTILGLQKPVKGRVYINGVDVTGCPEKAGVYVGYVPQIMYSETHYPITPWELVSISYMMHKGLKPRLWSRKGVKERVIEVLEKVGLRREKWNSNFWKLSGGERQRVLIARAIVHNPPILLLDEPLAPVDPVGKVEIARLITSFKRDKLVIVTSHDPMLFLEHTDIVILINRKVFIMGRPEEVLTIENTRRVYGEAAIQVKEHIHISDHH